MSVAIRGKIRPCSEEDIAEIYEVTNEAAKAYKAAVPAEAYREPQMPMDELLREFKRIKYFAYIERGRILGVMGYEFVEDVALIRHAYVRPQAQQRGIGSFLLRHVEDIIKKSKRAGRIVIGTYARASWAIDFYEKHGYSKSHNPQEILKMYYDIPDIQRVHSLTLEKNLTEQTR